MRREEREKGEREEERVAKREVWEGVEEREVEGEVQRGRRKKVEDEGGREDEDRGMEVMKEDSSRATLSTLPDLLSFCPSPPPSCSLPGKDPEGSKLDFWRVIIAVEPGVTRMTVGGGAAVEGMGEGRPEGRKEGDEEGERRRRRRGKRRFIDTVRGYGIRERRTEEIAGCWTGSQRTRQKHGRERRLPSAVRGLKIRRVGSALALLFRVDPKDEEVAKKGCIFFAKSAR